MPLNKGKLAVAVLLGSCTRPVLYGVGLLQCERTNNRYAGRDEGGGVCMSWVVGSLLCGVALLFTISLFVDSSFLFVTLGAVGHR